MKFLSTLALAAFAGILLAPSVHADDWNKKTDLTVTEPIRLPSCCNPEHSVTLQPGKYVMVLVNSASDRHIVRVFAEDGTTVITTILAIPNYRLNVTSKTAFSFWEVPAGQTKAMRAWFYPGDNFGQEFAYPKDVAVQIAAFGQAPVPVIEASTDEELATAKVAVAEPTGLVVEPVEVAAYVPPTAPVAAPDPAPIPTLVADTPAPAPVEATELPQTASPMPLIGLLGLLSSAGFMLSGLRKRSA
jgi:LPXTG-motif cell wall-anchored protein